MELYSYFSSGAKQAIYHASEVCQRYNHPLVEPQHALRSMLSQPDCTAVQVLALLQVDLPRLSADVDELLEASRGDFKGNPQFSAATLELLDLAFKAVPRLGHTEIDTVHLLIALLQRDDSLLTPLFAAHGLTLPAVCEATAVLPAAAAPLDWETEPTTPFPDPAAEEQFPGKQMELYNYFSFSAKKAVYRASEICQNFNNPLVEPEHVFFSILQLRSCSAVQVLNRLNVNLPKLTYGLEASLYERAGNFKGNPQFSARTLALLDLSFREVKRLNHREIGTTHLLIALAQERHAALRQILDENRLDARRLREAFTQHLKGFTGGVSAEQSESHATIGWPAGITDPVMVGGIPFTPDKTLGKESLTLLAGAAQLAVAFRQPEITPVELLAAMLIGAARPQLVEVPVLSELDSLALLPLLTEYWQRSGTPVGSQPSDPPLSPGMADLLGRALSQMLQASPSAAGRHYITQEQLLLALLDEPSEPVCSWLDGQLAANTSLADRLAEWRVALAAETVAARQAEARELLELEALQAAEASSEARQSQVQFEEATPLPIDPEADPPEESGTAATDA